MSRHQRKRARSADRDRVVEALTTAYVEGKLDDAEREERVTRALTAEGLDDLRPLVSDLQLPPRLRLAEPDVGGLTPGSVVLTGRPRSWRESKQRWEATPRWMKLLLGLLTVTVPAAVVKRVPGEGQPRDRSLRRRGAQPQSALVIHAMLGEPSLKQGKH